MGRSKTLAAAALALAFCVGSVSAQSGSITENTNIAENFGSGIPDESSISLSVQEAVPQEAGRLSTLWLFLRMVLVLAVVIACIYGVMWFMKRSMKTEGGGDPFLRRVSSIGLGAGKSVQIVTLVDHAYVLGVSENSVSLIGEVADKELVDSMNLYADRQSDVKKPRSFADILDIFMPGGPRGKGGAFEGSDARAADLLKRQRERMNGEV